MFELSRTLQELSEYVTNVSETRNSALLFCVLVSATSILFVYAIINNRRVQSIAQPKSVDVVQSRYLVKLGSLALVTSLAFAGYSWVDMGRSTATEYDACTREAAQGSRDIETLTVAARGCIDPPVVAQDGCARYVWESDKVWEAVADTPEAVEPAIINATSGCAAP